MITSRKGVAETAFLVLSLIVIIGTALFAGDGVTGLHTIGAGSVNCNPPVLGDWIINSDVYCVDSDIIIVNGSLQAHGAYNITLERSNLTFDNDNNSFYREINLSSDAELYFIGSSLLSLDSWGSNNLHSYLYSDDSIVTVYDSKFNLSYVNSIDSTILIKNSFFRKNEADNCIDFPSAGASNLTLDNVEFADCKYFMSLQNSSSASLNYIVTNLSFKSYSYVSFNINNSNISGSLSEFSDESSAVISNSSIYFYRIGKANPTTSYNGGLINFTNVGNNYLFNISRVYGGKSKLYGYYSSANLNPLMATTANLTRYYPVYVFDAANNPASGIQVNITNSTGDLIWQGSTDSNGYANAEIIFVNDNKNQNFNLSVNPSQIINLSSSTPIVVNLPDATTPTIDAIEYQPEEAMPYDNITLYINTTDTPVGIMLNCSANFSTFSIYNTTASIGAEQTIPIAIGQLPLGIHYFNATCSDGTNVATSLNNNITVTDKEAPYHWNIQESDSVYAPNKDYYFNISFNDSLSTIDSVWINFSNTIYTSEITNISEIFMFNRTGLAVGTYNYIWYANDTYNNTNQTTLQSFTVTKASPSCSLSFDKATPQVYGTAITASCSCTNPEATAELYIDDINATAAIGIPITLPADTYTFICNSTATHNYTLASNSSVFTITKATPSLSSSVTTPIDYGVASDYTASESNTGDGGCVYNLYRNNELIDTGSSVSDNSILAADTYTYIYNTTGCDNYTNATDTKVLIINKNTTSLSLTSVPNWNYAYGNITNISCTANNNEVNLSLYRNDTLVTNPYIEYLNATAYNFICNTTGSQNYTNASATNTLIITKADTTTSLLINGTANNQTFGYGDSINVSASTTQGTVSLYMNNTPVSNPYIVALGVGYYNFTALNNGDNNTNPSYETFFVNITKANTSSLSLNLGSAIISYGTGEGISASESNAGDNGCTYNLYRNNILINSGSTVSNNSVLAVGTYNYTYNTTGCANYTASSANITLTITQAIPSLTLTVNPSTSITQGTSSSITISCPTQLTCNAYRDNVPVVAPDTQTLSTGSYTYIFNTTGNVNYTNASLTSTLTINPSGGGGSSGGGTSCYPNWACSNWTCHENNTKTRSCVDLNKCYKDIPATIGVCTYSCVSNYACDPWTDCLNGKQTRQCYDVNTCYAGTYWITEEKSCAEVQSPLADMDVHNCRPEIICEYGRCINGQKEKYCYDRWNCGTVASTREYVDCFSPIDSLVSYFEKSLSATCKRLYYDIGLLLLYLLAYFVMFSVIDNRMDYNKHKYIRLSNLISILFMLSASVIIVMVNCDIYSKAIALMIFVFVLSRTIIMYDWKYFNINRMLREILRIKRTRHTKLRKKSTKSTEKNKRKSQLNEEKRLAELKAYEQQLKQRYSAKQREYKKDKSKNIFALFKQRFKKKKFKVKKPKKKKIKKQKPIIHPPKKYHEQYSTPADLIEFKEIAQMIKQYKKSKSNILRVEIDYRLKNASKINQARIKDMFKKL